MNDSTLNRELAALLPDIPRWLETRSMLLRQCCEVLGLKREGPSCVIHSLQQKLISVVGRPEFEYIQSAVSVNNGLVLTTLENIDYVAAALPNSKVGFATLHVLRNDSRLAEVPEGRVAILDPIEVLNVQVSDALREELLFVSRYSPIAATFEDNVPVSFCYAASDTETLWDVSIDTLEPYRNRGYAGWCVSFMIRYMLQEGKQPVWGSAQSNTASMKLAAKLGFVPVDEIAYF